MQITQEKLFFDKATAGGESAVVSLQTEGSMTMEISGDATAVSAIVMGQVYQPEDGGDGGWHGIAAVNQKDFSISSATIGAAGIYTVSVSGLKRLKVVLNSVTGGSVTVYGRLGV